MEFTNGENTLTIDVVCLFCDRNNAKEHRTINENELAYARWDNVPISVGHAEIVPKRHVISFFELSEDEVLAMYALAKRTRAKIIEMYAPDAFNLGVNDGEAAGRTIHHVHLHLIPRYDGDVENPRGGVRHLIPGKGNY